MTDKTCTINGKVFKIGDFVETVPPEDVIDLTPTHAENWLIVLTEPNREMSAQASLLLRRIPFYLPTILRPARLSAKAHAAGDTHEDVARPLFPGMIFITSRIVAAQDRTIRCTPGIIGSRPYLRLGDDAAIVTPMAMRAIQYIEAGERELYLYQRNRPSGLKVRVNDRVRLLVDDVLGPREGTIADIDDAGRITLLMEIMKRTVRVRMTADRIGAVVAEPAAGTSR